MARGPTLAKLAASRGAIRGLLAAAAVTGALACQPAIADEPEPVKVAVGGPAPPFSVQHSDGYWQAWTDFYGEAGLLIVFATKETSEELGSLAAERWSRPTLPVLLIDTTCGAGPEEVRSAYPEQDEGLSLRFDPRGDVARLYSVPAVPHAVAVNRDRQIVFMGGLGRTAHDIQIVKRALDAIAEGRKPAVSRGPVDGATRFRPYCMPDAVPPG